MQTVAPMPRNPPLCLPWTRPSTRAGGAKPVLSTGAMTSLEWLVLVPRASIVPTVWLSAGCHRQNAAERWRRPKQRGAAASMRGDRNGDLSALDAGRWDTVIDVSGYLPRQVREAAARLRGRAERYLFISSCAVYVGLDAPERDVGSPLKTLEDPTTETIDAATYGGLKVLCEQEAERAFPDHSLSLRPTFVVGPNDLTDRFTSWLRRVRRGGPIAAPIAADLPVAFIDVRDLARFTVDQSEAGTVGAVNVSGPARPTTWGAVLGEAKRGTSSDAQPSWVPLDALEAISLPLHALPMVSPYTFRGAAPYAVDRAVAMGLRFTPLDTTVRDTLAWDDAEGSSTQGLAPDDERRLLEAWRERGGGRS